MGKGKDYADKTFNTETRKVESDTAMPGSMNEYSSLYQEQEPRVTTGDGSLGGRHYASESVDDPAPSSGRRDDVAVR